MKLKTGHLAEYGLGIRAHIFFWKAEPEHKSSCCEKRKPQPRKLSKRRSWTKFSPVDNDDEQNVLNIHDV